MGNTGSIGGESSPIKPSGSEGVSGEPSQDSIEQALHTPVKSFDQLKQLLIKNLGKKDGTKLYNNFMKSFIMQIVHQMQQSAAAAKRASQSMRMQ